MAKLNTLLIGNTKPYTDSNKLSSDSESPSNSGDYSEYSPSVDAEYRSSQEEDVDMNQNKRPTRVRKPPTRRTSESVSYMAQEDPTDH